MIVKEPLSASKRFAQWVVPIDSSVPSGQKLEELVDQVISKNKNIRNVFEQSDSSDADLRKQLEYSILDAHQENRHLRRFSQYIDTMDKALVPFDVLADATKIYMGVGYYLSTAKEIVEMGPKLAYLAYYTAKTKDFVGAVGNLLYEGLSWFLPGSLLDLTNRYAKQSDKYVLKHAADKFLEKVDAKSSKKTDKPVFTQDTKPGLA